MTNSLQRAQVRDFDELKENAYAAALIGSYQNWDRVWRRNYLERYAPTSHQNAWREAIDLYSRYIKKEISLEEATVSMQRIQEDYEAEKENLSDFMGDMIEFATATTKAFEGVVDDVFNVEFVCPLCNGSAHATRVANSNRRNGFRARAAKCRSCGYSTMT